MNVREVLEFAKKHRVQMVDLKFVDLRNSSRSLNVFKAVLRASAVLAWPTKRSISLRSEPRGLVSGASR
ncbi:MAG: hypothetical protein HP477_01850 [Nitrospira sp.]|nr:hypothetical protein [Nitrospira sp.]